ncbi:ATP-binding cassette domain-containing protein, partial [Aquamicrobium sp.]|uniref:ATP-binding cassette domain-containing protein n=1 Tax=Aquamicrobium sp. TaxID=1872579 RepID=UPI002584D61F
QENGTAVLLISHDLGMVSHYVRDVVVMHRGRMVEVGRSADVLKAPAHDYTRRLVDALPRRPAIARPAVDKPETILEVDNIVVEYPGRQTLLQKREAKRAVDDITLTVARGETLALVGASGSGKTTLGRTIVGLQAPTDGRMRFRGVEIDYARSDKAKAQRRDIQIIFQDPYSSLDPRQTIAGIIGEPLLLEPGMTKAKIEERVREVMTEVGLPHEFTTRLPHQLSGGQRQRVAIARAIVRDPAFVVADEPVSALDMTVQKQILELIRKLQEKRGFACLFVSHDLGAVEQVADRVAVMENGRIVEIGDRDEVFDRPKHPYTKRLLEAAMLLDRKFEGAA